MYLTQILKSVVVLAGVQATVAAPAIPRSYSIPSSDGFPNPSSEQLATIQQKAGGQLSNAPPPAKLANSSLTAFQLIAFNENFEVAYFSSLIDNITNNAPGFQLDGDNKTQLLSILEAVKAVCCLHPPALGSHH